MKILTTPGWEEYALLDSGNSMRLERFGEFTLARPDPQAIWQPDSDPSAFEKTADIVFEKTSSNNGKWVYNRQVPDKWLIQYNDISFWAKPTPFKHTGIFPEQKIQWDWMRTIIENRISKIDNGTLKIEDRKIEKNIDPQPSILNLFAYTGIASLIAAKAGAKVTHVDASKPSIAWAKENQIASGLTDKPIRWILDDALKFVGREVKRDVFYDGIIMDPPVYGHGPNGEVWDFNSSFPQLLSLCRQVLSEKPLFILINAYALSSSAIMLQNMLEDTTKGLKGVIEVGELALEEQKRKRLLSTGIFGRWLQE